MYFLQPNQKRLLSSLNPVFLVVFVLLLIVFRSISEFVLPVLLRPWDVLLPFMVYFGQRRSFGEGLVLALFTSHLYSLCSSAPIGVFATYYLILFIISRLLVYVIYANTWISVFVLLLSLSLLSRLLLGIISVSFGHGWPIFSSVNISVLSLLFNAVLGLIAYVWLESLDRLTFKVPRINIELSESH